MENYSDFLSSKIKVYEPCGFEVPASAVHPSSLPHQADTIRWAVAKGRALIGSSFGLGKTHAQIEILRLIQEREGGAVLIICPLGVKHQFTEEDGPRLGVDIRYVRTDAEVMEANMHTRFMITNYERVRDGGIDVRFFTAVSLDEGSVLRSLGTKTTQQFIDLFQYTKYKFVCTATPSPNEFTEILNYAHFLGVMDRGQALTRWFQRDSQKAGNLTIHPHHERDFWLWVSSWALFLTRPSDLGHSDEGYDLPEMKVIWHRLASDPDAVHVDRRSGQTEILHSAGSSLQEAAKEKRSTLSSRVEKTKQIVEGNPAAHWLIWHHLEDERKAICAAIPQAVDVYGSQKLEEREERIIDFSRGKFQILATKPEIAGSGCNFQRFCHLNIFTGINYKFQDFIQAIHRTHRFQQPEQVEVHIIYTEAEEKIRRDLEAKWQRHNQLQESMREIIRAHGLSQEAAIKAIGRSMGVKRQQVQGDLYTAIRNDSVQELKARPDNSMGMWLTSVPFGNHYEYSAAYEDFGHNEDNRKFFEQMDFLIPEMLRTLKPGRVAAVHVKDRIRYGSVTGLGFMHIDRFSDQTADAFEKHGFIFCGRATVLTDVVRENNQTYRLGWSEQCKDGTKMGFGLPEYVLLFRKLPSDLSNAYADEPVVKSKDEYTRGRWQLDAHSFWRSSGNRLLTPDEVRGWDPDRVRKWFHARNLQRPYDYAEHVELCETLDEAGRLPSTFMLLEPQSYQDDIWTDINYMHSLNGAQSQKRERNHICPLPFDIVDRCITRWSNPGDVVGDPFAGLFTVPVRAMKLGRRGWGCELNAEYFRCGTGYLRDEEYRQSVPTLFDFIESETEKVA